MTNDAPARTGRIRSATIDRRCARLVHLIWASRLSLPRRTRLAASGDRAVETSALRSKGKLGRLHWGGMAVAVLRLEAPAMESSLGQP
jgi:hypothetical protein